MSALFDSAKFVMSIADVQALPNAALPEIAFAGRSNAGKSSTINALCRQNRLAFTSKMPGRTQLINYFELSQKGQKSTERVPVSYLVDLPGYGFAKAAPEVRKQWESLVGGYVLESPSLLGMVVVMDARRPLMPADEFLLDFLSSRHTGIRIHFLLNKADQIKTAERRVALSVVEKRANELGDNVSFQLFSALKKEGVEQLRNTLCSWLGLPPQS